MTKIQIELDEESNKILEIYKSLNGLKSKKLAIKELIKEHKILLHKLQNE